MDESLVRWMWPDMDRHELVETVEDVERPAGRWGQPVNHHYASREHDAFQHDPRTADTGFVMLALYGKGAETTLMPTR